MTPPAPTTQLYKRHRFPAEIISHCVWLYFRFSLSYRDVEEMMLERGVLVSHEAVRYWCRKFGQSYANQLHRWRPRPGDKWHLDEAFLTINGARYYLWRAVDQDDNVLDILVPSRRNKKAAKKFFKKLLKGLQYVPRVIITDKLKSYGAAKREIVSVNSFLDTFAPKIRPVIPVYSYSLKCLTFESLPRILISDQSALFLALFHEGGFHALRLIGTDNLRHIALPISRIPPPRKHRLTASALGLSTNR
jgi:transposase-like protein